MRQMIPELVTLTLGCVSVIIVTAQQLPDLRTKRTFYVVVFVIGSLVQLATQGTQYFLSESYRSYTQKREDAEIASSLYTFLNNDEELLADSSSTNYLVGYKYFRDGKWSDASQQFTVSINDERFVAECDYLLAYMESHTPDHKINDQGNWEKADEYLTAAIEYDPKYSAAHYLRAELDSLSHHPDDAIAELKRAVETNQGAMQCYDIVKNDDEIKSVWNAINTDTRFKELQQECIHKYKIFKSAG